MLTVTVFATLKPALTGYQLALPICFPKQKTPKILKIIVQSHVSLQLINLHHHRKSLQTSWWKRPAPQWTKGLSKRELWLQRSAFKKQGHHWGNKKEKEKPINSLDRFSYKKTFDSVPHDWILKCLEMYKLSPIIVQFLTGGMEQWKTTPILNHSEGTLYSRQININSGIFQGDSLSLSSPVLHGCCSTKAILTSQQHQLLLYYKYMYHQSPILHGWPENIWKQWPGTN